MSLQHDVQACEARLANSTRAHRSTEKLRMWVNAIPVVGAPLAMGLAWLHPLLGSVAVATLTLAWLLGIHRAELLCQRTAGRLQDAELDLSRARAYAPPDERGYEQAPVPWSRAAARNASARRPAPHRPLH